MHLIFNSYCAGDPGFETPANRKKMMSKRRDVCPTKDITFRKIDFLSVRFVLFRTYKFSRRPVAGGAARGILDGDLVTLYTSLPIAEQQDVCYAKIKY